MLADVHGPDQRGRTKTALRDIDVASANWVTLPGTAQFVGVVPPQTNRDGGSRCILGCGSVPMIR
jgi:hypothetical protein